MSASLTAAETLASSPTSDLVGDVEGDNLKLHYIIRQQPISVTLSGPAIFLATLALILLIHFLEPYHAQLLVSLVPVVLLVHNDYQNFLNLGPGGTPATFRSYIIITWFKLWCLRDPFTAPKPDPSRVPTSGILGRHSLPYRAGPLPVVTGIAPQRQLDQHGSRHCYRALRRAMSKLASQYPDKFTAGTSCLEKHGLALFARYPLQTNCQGEIFHLHDSDHSMHMCLHPDDIKEVLKKGWGQRHPLSQKSPFIKTPVTAYFVMIYAPRDDQELHIICRILEAAIWNTLAEEAELKP